MRRRMIRRPIRRMNFRRRRFNRKGKKRSFRRRSNPGKSFTLRTRIIRAAAPTPDGQFTTPLILQASQYPIVTQMAQNFESYRILSATVTITPTFNALGTQDEVGLHCIAPYHRALTTSTTGTYDNLIQMPRAKIRRANQSLVMKFKPAVPVYSLSASDQLSWSPRLLTTTAGLGESHYLGLYASSGSYIASRNVNYQIVYSLVFRLYNPKPNTVQL